LSSLDKLAVMRFPNFVTGHFDSALALLELAWRHILDFLFGDAPSLILWMDMDGTRRESNG